jgi:type II secretory ATPase GspE/PulE/Tfp pilus assembly ATPase PilB-like protein
MAGQDGEYVAGSGAQSVHRAEKAYSVYQIADLLGSAPGEVMGWIEKGWLQCRRVGNEPIRVGQSQLLDFLQKRGIDITNVLARAVNNAAGVAKVAPVQPVMESLPTEVAPPAGAQSGTVAPPVSSHVADVPASRETVRADAGAPGNGEEENHSPYGRATHGQDAHATENHGRNAHATQDANATQDGRAAVDGVDQLAGAVLADAVAKGASAIHVEAWRGGRLTLRYRIDGLLHDKTNFASRLPSSAAWTLLVHLGQMAGMDLARGHMPLAGQFSMQVDGRQVHFHASSCPLAIDMPDAQPGVGRAGAPGRPTVALVISILDPRRAVGLEQLAGPATREKLARVLQHDGGLIIVAGMPKSGKNAVLQAMLAELVAQPSRRGQGFAAIQNAPGAMIEGVRQVYVQPELGFTFTKATEAISRQDCDVVMMGDVRDPHCASMCLEMALEGRMVFAGMTARGGAGAMAMLEMMALESWPLASALLAVVGSAQLPKLCEHCKVELEPRQRDKWLAQLDLGAAGATIPLLAPGSCSRCGQLGYSGKVSLLGVAECGGEIAGMIRRQAWARLRQGDCQAMDDANLKALALGHLHAGSVTPDSVAGLAGGY